MTGISRLIYKDKEILCIDYQGMNEAQMITAIKDFEYLILSENKPHLQLVNLNGAYTTPAYMKVANEFGQKTKKLTQKGAVVGINQAKRIIFASYNAIVGGKLKPFASLEEAKEYLVTP